MIFFWHMCLMNCFNKNEWKLDSSSIVEYISGFSFIRLYKMHKHVPGGFLLIFKDKSIFATIQ